MAGSRRVKFPAQNLPSGGGDVVFDMRYFDQALSLMRSPEIDELILTIKCSITTAAATTFYGLDAPGLFAKLHAEDLDGEFMDISGPAFQAWLQEEFGQRSDVSVPGDQGASTTNASYVYRMTIPARLRKAERDVDTCIPLALLQGAGKFIVTICGANTVAGAGVYGANVTLNAGGTLELEAVIREGDLGDSPQREPELKSRLKLKMWPMNAVQDQRYTVGGRLRALFIHAPGAQGGASMSAITNIESSDIDGLVNYDKTTLLMEYNNEQPASSKDVFNAARGVMFEFSKLGQKTLECKYLDSVQVKVDAAPPTNSQVVVACYTKRSPASSIAVLNAAGAGITNEQQLYGLIHATGKVKTVGSNPARSVNAWTETAGAQKATMHLPIKVPIPARG